jgi:hypothetical protein
MRIKIKRSLEGGEYFVTFETVDFSEEESERIRKFGMPEVDLSMDGWGAKRLGDINITLKCESLDKAEDTISRLKGRIREGLSELMSKVDTFSGEEISEL